LAAEPVGFGYDECCSHGANHMDQGSLGLQFYAYWQANHLLQIWTQPKMPCWKGPVQVAHKSPTDTTSIFCLQPCTKSLESNINACMSKGTTLWCIICSTGPNRKRFLPFLSITVLLLLVNASPRSFFSHIFSFRHNSVWGIIE